MTQDIAILIYVKIIQSFLKKASQISQNFVPHYISQTLFYFSIRLVIQETSLLTHYFHIPPFHFIKLNYRAY